MDTRENTKKRKSTNDLDIGDGSTLSQRTEYTYDVFLNSPTIEKFIKTYRPLVEHSVEHLAEHSAEHSVEKKQKVVSKHSNDYNNTNDNPDHSDESSDSDESNDFSSLDDYERMYHMMPFIIENKLWEKINRCGYRNVCNLGDIVSFKYISDSQLYTDIYDRMAFTGMVIFIDNENNNMIIVDQFAEVDRHGTKHVTVRTFERDGCHSFGLGKGYTCITDVL